MEKQENRQWIILCGLSLFWLSFYVSGKSDEQRQLYGIYKIEERKIRRYWL